MLRKPQRVPTNITERKNKSIGSMIKDANKQDLSIEAWI